jgi:hypothetical protein
MRNFSHAVSRDTAQTETRDGLNRQVSTTRAVMRPFQSSHAHRYSSRADMDGDDCGYHLHAADQWNLRDVSPP